jgi:putative PIG3 family NAD(P)H quinone oxidoreductase
MASSDHSKLHRYYDLSGFGGPEVLAIRTGPRPEVSAGEVLIRVRAAGLNRPDIAQRSGKYPPPPGASPVLGLEVSGTIAAVGPGVEATRVGERVCALVPGGGYAEYCATPADHCLPIPRGLSFEEAAAIPETFFTVWSNVFDRGKLRAGETFLVHGGTSGIGVTAIQLARAFGAKVATTAGSEEKCRRAREIGADLAISYRTQDFVTEVARFTDGKGVNLILDMVGGPYFERNLECLATEGRLVQIAFLQGGEVPLKLARMMAKRIMLTGSMLRPRSVAEKTAIASGLREHVWPLLESGKVRIVLDRVYPFEEAIEAHRRMESSEHVGKIIFKVSEGEGDAS